VAIYEYKCKNEHFYEENRPIDKPQVQENCPVCAEELRRVFSTPVINLVGRGFYRNGG
jgi:putative FmdB family regulatory protein